MSMNYKPVVWTIAGSDSGGGAGIQGDLKTMNALGVHGCSVLTAITAQNTLGVLKTAPVERDILEAQLEALADDLKPDAVKTGMLAVAETVHCIIPYLRESRAPIICDPLLHATSGRPLLSEEGVDLMKKKLFPMVTVLTPNIPEAEKLSGVDIQHVEDREAAAKKILDMGVGSVLIKGGHGNQPYSQDFWTDGKKRLWLTSERQPTLHNHGTGCTLSSAIASFIALGFSIVDALVLAKAYINQGLRKAGPIGKGRGPLHHGGWPRHADDLPWITPTAEEGLKKPVFTPEKNIPMGLYPVVESAAWVERLLKRGVQTVQLRIKDAGSEGLAGEVRRAVELGNRYAGRVYINDHWEQAVECQAYGVHLGQDDLTPRAIDTISRAGLRLGISTHNAEEIARAWALNPSYIALGTVFKSPSKPIMYYAPLGLQTFRRLRPLIPVPTVAIGGITPATAPDLIAAGADGIAVISNITKAENLEDRLQEWTRIRWTS